MLNELLVEHSAAAVGAEEELEGAGDFFGEAFGEFGAGRFGLCAGEMVDPGSIMQRHLLELKTSILSDNIYLQSGTIVRIITEPSRLEKLESVIF